MGKIHKILGNKEILKTTKISEAINRIILRIQKQPMHVTCLPSKTYKQYFSTLHKIVKRFIQQ